MVPVPTLIRFPSSCISSPSSISAGRGEVADKGNRGNVLWLIKLGKAASSVAYSILERSGAVQVRMCVSDSQNPRFGESVERRASLSAGIIFGLAGSSLRVEPDVDTFAVVFDEYDEDSAGVSENGSLGARGRFACVVVDVIGGAF